MQRNYVTIRPLNREDSDDPLDREIDLGASLQPHAPHPPAIDSESPSHRWPIAAIFLVFAILVALSVGFFLRAPRPTPVPEKKGVDETIVDLPSSAPTAPNATEGKPAPNAAAPVAPVAPVAPKVSEPGRLLIRSTPADADVIVNGKPRGKTPLALRDLELGSYTIRVALSGYVPEEQSLQLTAQRPAASTTIELRRETAALGLPAKAMRGASATAGGVNVRSRPEGARVYVNNRLAGKTPISIPSLPAGPATVRIEMDGYRLWTTRVNVKAGEQISVAASLERP